MYKVSQMHEILTLAERNLFWESVRELINAGCETYKLENEKAKKQGKAESLKQKKAKKSVVQEVCLLS